MKTTPSIAASVMTVVAATFLGACSQLNDHAKEIRNGMAYAADKINDYRAGHEDEPINESEMMMYVDGGGDLIRNGPYFKLGSHVQEYLSLRYLSEDSSSADAFAIAAYDDCLSHLQQDMGSLKITEQQLVNMTGKQELANVLSLQEIDLHQAGAANP